MPQSNLWTIGGSAIVDRGGTQPLTKVRRTVYRRPRRNGMYPCDDKKNNRECVKPWRCPLFRRRTQGLLGTASEKWTPPRLDTFTVILLVVTRIHSISSWSSVHSTSYLCQRLRSPSVNDSATPYCPQVTLWHRSVIFYGISVDYVNKCLPSRLRSFLQHGYHTPASCQTSNSRPTRHCSVISCQRIAVIYFCSDIPCERISVNGPHKLGEDWDLHRPQALLALYAHRNQRFGCSPFFLQYVTVNEAVWTCAQGD